MTEAQPTPVDDTALVELSMQDEAPAPSDTALTDDEINEMFGAPPPIEPLDVSDDAPADPDEAADVAADVAAEAPKEVTGTVIMTGQLSEQTMREMEAGRRALAEKQRAGR